MSFRSFRSLRLRVFAPLRLKLLLLRNPYHMQDSTHTIMQSAKRFFSGTMLSRISGMLRDMAMAYAFGTQEAIAAFLVAFRLSHLLRRLFGEGALQSAFIPQFESLRSTHPQRACGFFRDLTAWLVLGLTAVIIVIMGILGSIWAYADLSPGNAEIVFLTLLLMPSLLFICLFGLNASLLQCEKSYFTSGVAPVAFNLIWIVGVICLWHKSPTAAMPWLAAWVIVACLAQWLITVPRAWRILKSHEVGFWSNLKLHSSDIKGLSIPLFLGIIGVAATQVNNALDAIFARYADAEGPALLWYALRIQQLPLALFGVAISGALLPPLTRALKDNDFLRYRSFLQFALKRSIALMLPITVGLFIMGDTCIALLYGRGDFDVHSISGTTRCLWGYNIGLIPMALVLILAPAFYAQKNPRTPATASVICVVLNVSLNTLLIAFLGLGAASVAVATSISAWVNFGILAYALTEMKEIVNRSLILEIGKVFLASGMACIAVLVLDLSFHGSMGSTAWLILNAKNPQYSEGFIALLMHLMGQGACFIGTLWGMAKLLDARDILDLIPRKRPVESQ